MSKILSTVFLGVLFLSTSLSAADPKALAKLKANLQTLSAGAGADWGIYVRNIDTGDEIAINADTVMDTMSVIKIPVMVEAFRQIDAGKIKLNDRIEWNDNRRRWGTGILQTLDSGLQPTLKDAIMLMINVSDNSATDMVMEKVGGVSRVNQTMKELGLKSITATGTTFEWFRALAASLDPSYNKYQPGELYQKGWPQSKNEEAELWKFHSDSKHPFGLSTARDTGKLLEMLVQGKLAKKESNEMMIAMMREQVYRTRIPKYLPGWSQPHKTGDFPPYIANDVGIIEPGKSRVVFVVFTAKHRGLYPNLEDTIARMALEVYNFYDYREEPATP